MILGKQNAENPLRILGEQNTGNSKRILGEQNTGNSKRILGKGEYLIFPHPSDVSIFNTCYKILTSNNRKNNRYQLNIDAIKEIDFTLEIAFIPSTLYELIFIRKCIKEDLKNGHICYYLRPVSHKRERCTDKKCLHQAYFIDAGDDMDSGVMQVAYRMNKSMVKLLSPTSDGFTYEQYLDMTTREVKFLREYYRDCLNKIYNVSSCTTPGPTTCFGYESYRGSIKPMCIRNDDDAEIIYQALKLECHVENAWIIYRGTGIKEDLPYKSDIPYSLSYGSSLFAGILFDSGATAYHYMRNNYAYAIVVPFDEIPTSPFYIPETNTLTQLFGHGEIFHVRTKMWRGADECKGFNIGINSNKKDHLKSDMSQEELIAKFQSYPKISLK